jgi:hypothetical protein
MRIYTTQYDKSKRIMTVRVCGKRLLEKISKRLAPTISKSVPISRRSALALAPEPQSIGASATLFFSIAPLQTRPAVQARYLHDVIPKRNAYIAARPSRLSDLSKTMSAARAFEGLFLFHGRRAPATRRLDACRCHVRVTLTFFFAACRPGAALPVEESNFSCPGKKFERLYPPA